MKSFIYALILALFVAAEAHAQEASVRLNVESVARSQAESQRAPMLALQGDTATAQKAASLPPVNQSANKKIALAKSIDGGAATATNQPPEPMVFSGAQPAQSGAYTANTSGNLQYDQMVMQSAARNGVDPNLIFAVMRQESGFNPRARSYKGACGLMQLMPATARRFGVTNVFDPAENIEGGARYLRFLLDSFNEDVELALAGYNAGEGAVINAGYKIPRYRETQNYVRSISARYGFKKHAQGRATRSLASTAPVAPEAATFSGGASSRLSNNY